MTINIDNSWLPFFENEINKPYFQSLNTFVTQEYLNNNCFPPESNIFNAFTQCSLQDVKVVIIGQDPYHGIGQANGLCFSVNDGIKHPPSLINIFKELEQDLGIPYPKSGNLMRWAEQGVFLLNATLTVRENVAGSHQNKGWEKFTDEVIKTINENKEKVIFLLWGGFAKKKTKLINKNKHFVLACGHPSPLSANRGYWFGNKHFRKANYLLEQAGLKPVDW
ncbi:uracil-DNA glycosylase [Formosa maritima]|uniref:Uracil-DNA glycosylase n=1 Tax=Formosa maritima TaxID=2592046 RepID=A0A5D0GJ63_9FLAO|nr:uracil-DNA glycosylase [Formosa maritima]TYA59038.1 uracil-DNA glycosylase [Formosa maritima]